MNDPLTILFAQADDETKANLSLSFLTAIMKDVKRGVELELSVETKDDKKFKVTVVEQ